jgi:amidase
MPYSADPIMTEIWQLTATALAACIRARSLSAVQAAKAALARLDEANPAINAVVAHRPEEVLAEAQAIDAALARGEDPGPLAGVPVTIKVNTDQTGHANTEGVRFNANRIAASNNPVVDNFRRSGAVILGRTNTPAFSLRWFTENSLHGATRNPIDPALTPGGSSGGAAASVARGIGHIAHGTDIGGSIRYPAYACGVHGLRPTLGRIAAFNATMPERRIGAQLMAVSGPIARSIPDLRAALAALAAPDPRDPWYVPAPLEGPPYPRRAKLCLRPDGLAIEPEVESALLEAAMRLRDAGWAVEQVETIPPLREAATLQMRLWLGDGFAAFEAAVQREADPGALAVLQAARETVASLPPDAVPEALTRRATLRRAWQLFLAENPLLLLPVSATLPFPANADMAGPAAFHRIAEAQLTQLGLPLIGVPALAVTTAAGGVQLVAAPYREDICLAAGEAIAREVAAI